MKRSISFYEASMAPLGIHERFDFAVRMGRRDTPISKALVQTVACSSGFVKAPRTAAPRVSAFAANNRDQVDAAYAAAIPPGATDNGAPSARLYYDPRYYAANVFDPDDYSIEFVYKSWQLSRKSETP